MNFLKYLNEAHTIESIRMEKYIVDAWNNPKSITDEGLKYTIDYLKKAGVKGPAEHLGTGAYKTTSLWQKYSDATQSVPKTDIIIGNRNISLKNSDGFQLTSGGKEEMRATLFSVMDQNYEGYSELMKNLDKKIKNLLSTTLYPQNISQMKSTGSLPDDLQKVENLQRDLTSDLNALFANHQDFKLDVVSECMSGDLKFGSNSPARAQYALMYGQKTDLTSVDDAAFLSKIAEKSRFVIGWKSVDQYRMIDGSRTKVGFNILSAMRVNIDKSAINKMANEGIVSDTWTKIKSWFNNNIINVMNFMGIEPDISYNNTIKW